jgi:hypothetical protein
MARKPVGSIAAILLMAASYPVFALPSFQGGWESGTVTGIGNANWLSLQAVAADRFTLINDGVRPGTYARVEVRPGDNPLACCYDTDRAEVSGMQNADGTQIFENENSGTQRYSFSVKLDANWETIVDHGNGAWGIFLQLHGPDGLGLSPALAFSATDQIRFNMLVGDVAQPTTVGISSSLGALNTGHWIDFILTTKFAADETGFVNILRRDEGQASFQEVLNLTNTPTLQFDSTVNGGTVGDHYWKTGLYRNRQDFTSVLYLDGMTREAVASVPEPEIYAMMLCGMALLSFATRRR